MAHLTNTTIFGDLEVTGSINAELAASNRVAFDVGATVGKTAAQQTYTDVYLNLGNGFSTTTSRFTAPIKGTYIFHFTTIKSAISTTVLRAYLYKNGAALYGNRHLRLPEANSLGDNGVSSFIVDMEVNDYVYVYIGEATSHVNPQLNYFNGCLIG